MLRRGTEAPVRGQDRWGDVPRGAGPRRDVAAARRNLPCSWFRVRVGYTGTGPQAFGSMFKIMRIVGKLEGASTACAKHIVEASELRRLGKVKQMAQPGHFRLLGSFMSAGLLLGCRGTSKSPAVDTTASPVERVQVDPALPRTADAASVAPDDGMVRIAGAKGVQPTIRVPVADVSDVWIDRTEVTVAAYKKCVDAGDCDPVEDSGYGCFIRRADAGDFPVTCVSQVQADRFCWRLGKRLPTLAELFVAAKSVEVRGCEDTAVGRIDGVACSRRDPAPVGTTPRDASTEGVRDLFGNVEEWTSTIAPSHLPDGRSYWIFGASYGSSATAAMRPAAVFDEATVSPAVGFRCARNIDAPSDRSRPEEFRPRPTQQDGPASPLKAPWVARFRKDGGACEPFIKPEVLCRRGCVGFEDDPDCVTHCELACDEWDSFPCARREEQGLSADLLSRAGEFRDRRRSRPCMPRSITPRESSTRTPASPTAAGSPRRAATHPT